MSKAKATARKAAAKPRKGRGAPSRPQIVWATFLGAMTMVSGLMLFLGGQAPATQGALIATSTTLADRDRDSNLLNTARPIDRARWQSIVIHHSGSPAGDPQSLHKRHVADGLEGLGYHFVLGNGNGMADGVINVSQRWDEQTAGQHAIGRNAAWLNEHAIGICLIGNGDGRAFTEVQLRRLVQLVQALQREFDIPASRVYLHRDVAEVKSPGRYFPEASFREQLVR